MSPESQCLAIAEACPDLFVHVPSPFGPGRLCWREGQDDNGKIIRPGARVDPLSDLNIIHAAEEILTEDQQSDWIEHMADILGMGQCDYAYDSSRWKYARATAAQRVEVFLLTLNLWEGMSVTNEQLAKEAAEKIVNDLEQGGDLRFTSDGEREQVIKNFGKLIEPSLTKAKEQNEEPFHIGQVISFQHGPDPANTFTFKVLELGADGKPSKNEWLWPQPKQNEDTKRLEELLIETRDLLLRYCGWDKKFRGGREMPMTRPKDVQKICAAIDSAMNKKD